MFWLRMALLVVVNTAMVRQYVAHRLGWHDEMCILSDGGDCTLVQAVRMC